MTEWVSDSKGNKCSAAYFGSIEAAQRALDSLKDCKNCINCSDCSDCSHCSRCSDCSDCSDCSHCSRCSDCSRCSGLYLKDNFVAASAGEVASIKAEDLGQPKVPKIENIHQRVLAAVSQPHALKMDHWHTCETTHCRAGWVVHLAGDAGRKLELFHNTELAAHLIYRESSPHLVSCARFYDKNKEAMADIVKMAELETAK